jgi:hypothetical protein
MTRARLLPESLVGSPYKRGGTNEAEGFDCFTLLEYVRRVYYGKKTPHAGIPAADMPSMQACALAIYRATGGKEQVSTVWYRTDPVDGCAVALGRSRYGRLHHCGVLVDSHVMHALETVGVTMCPLERMWYLYGRVEFYECPS